MRSIQSSVLLLAAVCVAVAAQMSPAAAADRGAMVERFGHDVRGAIMNPRGERHGIARDHRLQRNIDRGRRAVQHRNDGPRRIVRQRPGPAIAWQGGPRRAFGQPSRRHPSAIHKFAPRQAFRHPPRRHPQAIHKFAPRPNWAWQKRAHRFVPGHPQLRHRQFGMRPAYRHPRALWLPPRLRR